MPDLVSRGKFESRLADTLVTVFEKHQLEIQILLSSFDTKLAELGKLPQRIFDALQADMATILEAVLIEAYIEAFTSMDGFLADNSQTTARRGALFIREDAQQWASFYAPQLAKQMADITKTRLREIADRSPLLPISGLGIRNVIKPMFGMGRAQLVARTELTNVISVAEQVAVNTFEATIEAVMIWYTKLDERVCIICRPRHDRERGINWEIPPPAHPRCRCETKWRITYSDGRVIEVRSLEEIEMMGKARVVEL